MKTIIKLIGALVSFPFALLGLIFAILSASFGLVGKILAGTPNTILYAKQDIHYMKMFLKHIFTSASMVAFFQKTLTVDNKEVVNITRTLKR